MADILVDFANYIISKGYATKDGVDVFRDMIPASPDSVVAIYEYFGAPFANKLEGGIRHLQIVVRRTTYASARADAWALHNIFNDETKESIFEDIGTRRMLVVVTSTPLKVQADGTGITRFSFNLSVTVQND